jgi:MYXO-CTERM domain-containing protein
VGGMAGLAVALTGLGGYSALRRRRRASRVSRD